MWRCQDSTRVVFVTEVLERPGTVAISNAAVVFKPRTLRPPATPRL
jgi:hypothetical protein